MWDKSWPWWAHWIHLASPESHIFLHPWVGLTEVAGSQRSGLAALGCGSSWPSLKLPIWWFNNAGEYLFSGRKCPHICKGICWWQMNGFPTHCGSDAANASPVVSQFSCMGLCTQIEWIYLEFQFLTSFCVMATRSSDLDNQKPGVDIQTEGHTLTPPSGQNGSEDPEAFVAPHCIHHPSLQQGNQYLTCLRLGIVWKYSWAWLKMEEQHDHLHMPGRHQLWKTWSEMANLA